jgi:hypothetical protein
MRFVADDITRRPHGATDHVVGGVDLNAIAAPRPSAAVPARFVPK